MRKGTSQGCPLEAGQIPELSYVLSKGIVPSGIGKEQGQIWTGRPLESARAVSAMLALDPVEALWRLRSYLTYPTSTTIKVGTCEEAGYFQRALRDASCHVTESAKNQLEGAAFASSIARREGQIELVFITGADLDIVAHDTHERIYQKAFSLDLGFCPAEVAPQLILQAPNQLAGNILVAMELIAGLDGVLRAFSIGRGPSGPELCTDERRPFDLCGAGRRWVFCRKPNK